MKAILLAVVLTSFSPTIPKPKFRKIDKLVPVCLIVKTLSDNTDDDISTTLKKVLSENGFNVVSMEDFKKLSAQYFKDVDLAMRSGIVPGQVPSKEAMARMYRSGTPSQKLTLIYRGGDSFPVTYNTCDSIGISIFKLPLQLGTPSTQTYFFPVKQMNTANPDSIAMFLISKL